MSQLFLKLLVLVKVEVEVVVVNLVDLDLQLLLDHHQVDLQHLDQAHQHPDQDLNQLPHDQVEVVKLLELSHLKGERNFIFD